MSSDPQHWPQLLVSSSKADLDSAKKIPCLGQILYKKYWYVLEESEIFSLISLKGHSHKNYF
jgi:hypothetical protein